MLKLDKSNISSLFNNSHKIIHIYNYILLIYIYFKQKKFILYKIEYNSICFKAYLHYLIKILFILHFYKNLIIAIIHYYWDFF